MQRNRIFDVKKTDADCFQARHFPAGCTAGYTGELVRRLPQGNLRARGSTVPQM